MERNVGVIKGHTSFALFKLSLANRICRCPSTWDVSVDGRIIYIGLIAPCPVVVGIMYKTYNSKRVL